MNLSIIIPTFQAAQFLPELLSRLYDQTVKSIEVILVDSGSTDGTADFAASKGCKVISIAHDAFRHGRARNLGARAARGEILVFLTQDALPIGPDFLDNLTIPLRNGVAVAATARQVAYPQANPLEQFARHFNYPSQPFVRTLDDINTLGIKAYFFSNTASAVWQDIFWRVGGFNEEVIVNEDMFLCSVLLHAGFSVAYQAQASVFHSHEYSLFRIFQRYFDIGIFFSQAGDALQGGNTGGEGLRFNIQASQALLSKRAWAWIPRLYFESGLKLIAFQVGRCQRLLPVWLKRKISGQRSYWS